MAENAGLSWVNYAADTAAVISASTEVATLPAANLVNDHIANKWRSAVGTDAWVGVDLGSSKAIGAIGLFGSNLTAATGLWRIRLSLTGLGNGDVLDTTMVDATIADGYEQAVYVPASPLTARYVRIDLSDAALATIGFHQAGYLWIGELWKPTHNFTYGAAHGREDQSIRSKSRGGQSYFDVYPSFRYWQFGFDFLSENEVFDEVAEMDRLVGKSKNMLFVAEPTGTRQSQQAILGTLTQLSDVRYSELNVFARRYEVEERK